MLIKTDKPASEQKGFNENTLEWKGRPLKEMHHKELVDIICNLFTVNVAMQQEIKEHRRILS